MFGPAAGHASPPQGNEPAEPVGTSRGRGDAGIDRSPHIAVHGNDQYGAQGTRGVEETEAMTGDLSV